MDIIDQIGEWRSVATIGVGNGKGYNLENLRECFLEMCLKNHISYFNVYSNNKIVQK